MALKYVVKKTVFGFDETKTEKYVARPVLAGTVDYSALCDRVTKVSTVSRGVVMMVMENMFDAIEESLSNHLSVKLGDFGSLRPTFGSKSQDEQQGVTAKVLRRRKILFTPGTHFKKILDGISIQKTVIR